MGSCSGDYFLPPREKVGGPVVSFETVGVLPNDGAGDGNGVSKFSGVVGGVGANVRSSGLVGSPVRISGPVGSPVKISGGGGTGMQILIEGHGNAPDSTTQHADSESNSSLPFPTIPGSLVQTSSMPL